MRGSGVHDSAIHCNMNNAILMVILDYEKSFLDISVGSFFQTIIEDLSTDNSSVKATWERPRPQRTRKEGYLV